MFYYTMASSFKTEIIGSYLTLIPHCSQRERNARLSTRRTPSGISLLPPLSNYNRRRTLGNIDLIQEYNRDVNIVQEEWRRDVEEVRSPVEELRDVCFVVLFVFCLSPTKSSTTSESKYMH